MKFKELTEAVDKKELLAKLKNVLLLGQPAGSTKKSHGDVRLDDETLEIRYWGHWEIPEDEEDDGDYDWEVLSQDSAKKLNDLIKKFEKENKCHIDYHTSEKNWILFRIIK